MSCEEELAEVCLLKSYTIHNNKNGTAAACRCIQRVHMNCLINFNTSLLPGINGTKVLTRTIINAGLSSSAYKKLLNQENNLHTCGSSRRIYLLVLAILQIVSACQTTYVIYVFVDFFVISYCVQKLKLKLLADMTLKAHL